MKHTMTLWMQQVPTFFRPHLRRMFWLLMLAGGLMPLLPTAALADSSPPVVWGIVRSDAFKHNVEFIRHDPAVPIYRKHGVEASLVELHLLFDRDLTVEQVQAALKPYHVVTLATTHEGVYKYDETWKRRAAQVGEGLARYVREGGGLLLHPQAVRYAGSDDEYYWNAVLEPLGLKLLHEGVCDLTRSFEGPSLFTATFWRTRNIQPHPVTEGVAGLCLPQNNYYPAPGLVAMQYSPDWTVVIRGEKEAKSYRSGEDNRMDLDVPGTYTEAPPVVAVRSLGKGRVVCYPLAELYAGLNVGNPLWAHVVETQGDHATGQPSDSLKLIMNACRWLAEPALAEPELGTFRPAPYQPIAYPSTVDFEAKAPRFDRAMINASQPVKIIMGAHSAYSDGKGSVAEFAAAARAAGLSGIVFNDPLELMTEQKLAQLKADCAAVSEAGVFYACPGIEFTDGIGNRWAFWGEKVVWPDASFMSDTFTHVQWDGKRINQYGQYNVACGFPGSALLDYDQLRTNGAHPENLWWFFNVLPLVYDHGKLIADNYNDYLFSLRDMRLLAPLSFTRITDPSEVAAAASTCHTGFRDFAAIQPALNTRCSSGADAVDQFVSQGPEVIDWQASNNQMEENWHVTRGAQRVQLHFAVRAAKGIAEVRVHDADRGLIRRFLGNGSQQLERTFELVHDQQHYLTLEIIDTAGHRAFSGSIRVYCYKSGLFRCGDNLNILGPTAMCWHPDRNQFFDAAKDFRNGSDYAIRGWDTSEAALGVPKPETRLWDMITLKETDGGEYPHTSREKAISGRLMDVGINNYDIQIATMRMDKLSESFDNAERPTPAMGGLPRDVADIAYYTRTHTIFAPMERVNMFTVWNHRRDREGRKDYRGGIIWHEGEYRFKQDVTLKGNVPIPLVRMTCPTDLTKNIGTAYVVTDAELGTRVSLAQNAPQTTRLEGRVKPGGYAAYLTTPVGYQGMLVPVDMDFAYTAHFPAERGSFIGLGRDGEFVPAGAVLKYRFGLATFADGEPGNGLLEHTVKALNLGGGQAGYPVEMRVGQVEDTVFFFTAQADGHEAVFSLGPQELFIDLPIRVRGLVDNGCVAIYSTLHPWFRFIPVDQEGTAWLTESIDQQNAFWVGNVFTCDHSEVKLTLVVDGQAKDRKPFLELHNPTNKVITAIVRSPEHTPVFGGMSGKVEIPAGDSVRLTIEDKKFNRD